MISFQLSICLLVFFVSNSNAAFSHGVSSSTSITIGKVEKGYLNLPGLPPIVCNSNRQTLAMPLLGIEFYVKCVSSYAYLMKCSEGYVYTPDQIGTACCQPLVKDGRAVVVNVYMSNNEAAPAPHASPARYAPAPSYSSTRIEQVCKSVWERYSSQTVGTLSVTQASRVVEEVFKRIELNNREVIQIARNLVEYVVIENKCSYTQLLKIVDLVYSVYSSTTVVSRTEVQRAYSKSVGNYLAGGSSQVTVVQAERITRTFLSSVHIEYTRITSDCSSLFNSVSLNGYVSSRNVVGIVQSISEIVSLKVEVDTSRSVSSYGSYNGYPAPASYGAPASFAAPASYAEPAPHASPIRYTPAPSYSSTRIEQVCKSVWERYSSQTVGTLSVTQASRVVEEVFERIELNNREVIQIARNLVEYVVIENKCSYTQLLKIVDLVYSVYSSTTVVSRTEVQRAYSKSVGNYLAGGSRQVAVIEAERITRTFLSSVQIENTRITSDCSSLFNSVSSNGYVSSRNVLTIVQSISEIVSVKVEVDTSRSVSSYGSYNGNAAPVSYGTPAPSHLVDNALHSKSNDDWRGGYSGGGSWGGFGGGFGGSRGGSFVGSSRFGGSSGGSFASRGGFGGAAAAAA